MANLLSIIISVPVLLFVLAIIVLAVLAFFSTKEGQGLLVGLFWLGLDYLIGKSTGLENSAAFHLSMFLVPMGLVIAIIAWYSIKDAIKRRKDARRSNPA